jgi:hypothetical protein
VIVYSKGLPDVLELLLRFHNVLRFAARKVERPGAHFTLKSARIGEPRQ